MNSCDHMYCNSCSFRINKYILQLICVREVCHWVLAQPLQRSYNTAQSVRVDNLVTAQTIYFKFSFPLDSGALYLLLFWISILVDCHWGMAEKEEGTWITEGLLDLFLLVQESDSAWRIYYISLLVKGFGTIN